MHPTSKPTTKRKSLPPLVAMATGGAWLALYSSRMSLGFFRRGAVPALLASGALLLFFEACGGDDGASIAPPAEDGSTPEEDTGTDAFVADVMGEAEASTPVDAARFCANQTADLCEDFEGTFPPSGWTSQVPEAGTLVATQGFAARGMSARIRPHDAGAEDGTFIAHTFAFGPAKKKLVVSARLKTLSIDPPYGVTPILVIGLGNDHFVTFAMTGALPAAFASNKAANGTSPGPSFAATFSFDTWHLVELEVARGATDTTFTARLDGKTLGTDTIAPIDGVAKSIAVGVRTDRNQGNRTIGADEVVVRTE